MFTALHSHVSFAIRGGACALLLFSAVFLAAAPAGAANVIIASPSDFGQSNLIVLNAGAKLLPQADNFLGAARGLWLNPGSELAGRSTPIANLTLGYGAPGVTLHSTTTLTCGGAVQLNGATLNFVLDNQPSILTDVTASRPRTRPFSPSAAAASRP